MIGLLLDALWAAFCVALGLGSVRVVGIALNARGRRRHARCLRNIERLEIANGFREAPPTWQDVLYHGRGSMFEIVAGAMPPTFVPPHDRGTPKVYAPAGTFRPDSAYARMVAEQAVREYRDKLCELANPGHPRG